MVLTGLAEKSKNGAINPIKWDVKNSGMPKSKKELRKNCIMSTEMTLKYMYYWKRHTKG